MKYVRTKDGHLLEIGKTTEYGFVCMPECKTAVHFVENGQEFVDVIRQSDKLEDLIDNIVIIAPNETQPFIVGKDIKGLEEYAKNNQVYGAIWTYKGLIFAAKMNDKGKLKLL